MPIAKREDIGSRTAQNVQPNPRKSQLYRWTTERKVNLGTGQMTHSFLMVLECSYPLLGRDLLSKVGAQNHCSENGVLALRILILRLEDEHRLFEPPFPRLEPQSPRGNQAPHSETFNFGHRELQISPRFKGS